MSGVRFLSHRRNPEGPPIEREQVVKWYKEGRSVPEMADHFGCSTTTMWYHIKKSGEWERVRPVLTLSEEEVLSLRSEGLSAESIAEKMGCSTGPVMRILTKAGVGKRTVSLGLRRKLKGVRFGRLVVMRDIGSQNHQRVWLCRCDCGKEIPVLVGQLTFGRTKSCGCIRIGYVGMFTRQMWGKYKKNMERFGSLQVTPEYLSEVFQRQNGRCPLTGLVIEVPTKPRDGSASLDRIDPSLGYVPGNCQWVDKRINFMKWKFDESYFVRLAKRVAEWSVRPVVPTGEQNLVVEELASKKKHPFWRGCGGITGGYWRRMFAKGRRKVNITIQQAWELFAKRGGVCGLSGVGLVLPQRNGEPCTASIDRIDNSRPYDIDNIQWVHKDVNFSKGDLSQDEFVFLCRAVASHS